MSSAGQSTEEKAPESSATENVPAPSTLTVPTPERAMKSIRDSATWVSEVVGEYSLKGKRMQSGAILDMMDLLAGRVAYSHCQCPLVTLSFDHVDLKRPILHNDLVKLEGKIIGVGSSSMTIQVQGLRHDMMTGEFLPMQTSFITMVAIDGNGRPNKNIPGLAYDRSNPEDVEAERTTKERKRLAGVWKDMQQSVELLTELDCAEVEDPINRCKQHLVTMKSSEIHVRKLFLPRNLNHGQTIFGGDILLWMDQTAMYCASAFTGSRNVVALSMNRVFFKVPLKSSDVVQGVARVVYVRGYTVEVEMRVFLEREGVLHESHTGYFTILNFDESGFKRKITKGLILKNEDQDDLKSYMKARKRHEFSMQMREESEREEDIA